MSTIESTTTLTAEQTELLARRDAIVQAWNQCDSELTKAIEARRAASKGTDAYAEANTAALSWGGKLANRKVEIRQAELDLRLEGIEFKPFVEPDRPRVSKSKLLPMTEEEIQTKLAAVRQLMGAKSTPDAVKHDCQVRVNNLLRAAKVRNYTNIK